MRYAALRAMSPEPIVCRCTEAGQGGLRALRGWSALERRPQPAYLRLDECGQALRGFCALRPVWLFVHPHRWHECVRTGAEIEARMKARQLERMATSERAMPAQGDATTEQWHWLCHPEFWLAVALGAALRLWALNSTEFLDDQASMMTIAREAVLRHALPVASIPSSIHTLNPPLSIYLLMPFVLLGMNPLPAVVALALWNVAGVALCYIFALRYFGRPVAAMGTLLFAVSPAAVGYSRFLWPPNYLAPLLILWAMAMYAGGVRGRRAMLIPAVVLLVLGALLHVTVLLLVPALIAGILLAPHLPRWRDYIITAAIVALVLMPTLLWEVVSGWSDLRLLSAYSSRPAKLDLEVFFRLYEALGTPGLPQSGSIPHPVPHTLGDVIALLATPITHPALGSASPYAAAARSTSRWD